MNLSSPAPIESAGLLPWLRVPLQQALANLQSHALLVGGPAGVGQFDFALNLATAWLCETPVAGRPGGLACGTCASCRLVESRSHPDLRLVVPEALRAEAGLPDDDTADEGRKRKPSREIRVEQMRAALHFSELTAGRGDVKVIVLHPAEALNAVSANALLKTLEEPPGGLRFVLTCSAPEALLPTVRSRCQWVHLAAPDAATAAQWLAAQGVQDAAAVLAATGGQPIQALEHVQAGRDAAAWRAFPEAVAAGQVANVADWPLGVLIDALARLCHDHVVAALGGSPRHFMQMPAPADGDIAALSACAAWLRSVRRHADHPWHAGLSVEALVGRVQHAIGHAARRRDPRNAGGRP